MARRFVCIWFRHLKTDWFTIRLPQLKNRPFVLSSPLNGRNVITSANRLALAQGIGPEMVVADARAILPSLEVLDDEPLLHERLLKAFADRFIRYSDLVAIELPDGLILNATGCAHLWGGEKQYVQDIRKRLKNGGYEVQVTMADTIGAAWAIAHFGIGSPIIECGQQMEALLNLPASALRLDDEVTSRLYKLGLRQVRQFIHMPRAAIRRRFGAGMILRLDQALGYEEEFIQSVHPVLEYNERLPCLEPIVTATGISIALHRLLEKLCKTLQLENKGIRKVAFKGFRIDNKMESIEIGTHRATINQIHLFKLFEEKISTMEPGPGMELFMLVALKTEIISVQQEKLWNSTCGLKDKELFELMDRLTNRFGAEHICRFIPEERYWPEKSFKVSPSFNSAVLSEWILNRPRPLNLLPRPVRIDVTAPVPDYPPMMFRFREKLHTIKKADGPERIESEWWLREGLHRDYYAVEDEEGNRFWLFREGHYTEDKLPHWFIHGFFS